MNTPWNKTSAALLSLVCLLFLSNVAFATFSKAPTVYVSVNAGYGYTNYQSNSAEAGMTPSYTNGSVALGGNVGFLFTPNVGLEVGYLNGGTNTVNFTPAPGAPSQTVSVISSSYFLTAAIKGIFYDNDNDINAFVKAGVAQGNITYQNNSALTGNASSFTQANLQAYVPYFALGVSQNMNKHLAVAVVGQMTLQSGNVPAAPATTDTPNRLADFYAVSLELTYAI